MQFRSGAAANTKRPSLHTARRYAYCRLSIPSPSPIGSELCFPIEKAATLPHTQITNATPPPLACVPGHAGRREPIGGGAQQTRAGMPINSFTCVFSPPSPSHYVHPYVHPYSYDFPLPYRDTSSNTTGTPAPTLDLYPHLTPTWPNTKPATIAHHHYTVPNPIPPQLKHEQALQNLSAEEISIDAQLDFFSQRMQLWCIAAQTADQQLLRIRSDST